MNTPDRSLPKPGSSQSPFASFLNFIRKPEFAYGASFCLGICFLACLEWPDPDKHESEVSPNATQVVNATLDSTEHKSEAIHLNETDSTRAGSTVRKSGPQQIYPGDGIDRAKE
ncbi:MAG: hypothetical protein AB8B55_14960 [Mariniblastus sp.]